MATEQSHDDQGQISHLKYSKRVSVKTILCGPEDGVGLIGRRVVIGGWVKSSRELRIPEHNVQPSNAGTGPKDVKNDEDLRSVMPCLWLTRRVFGREKRLRLKLDDIRWPKTQPQPSISILQISDGSCVPSLRVVVDSTLALPSQVMPTGTCILAEGILRKDSTHDKEIIELKADKILHIGSVDQDKYPMSKKRLPLENLRDHAHFRPRTTTVASVMRIRHALTQATHTFFQENGFLYVQVPIITTLLDRKSETDDRISADDFDNVELEVIRSSIRDKSNQVEELKRNDSDKEALAAAVHDMKKTKDLASRLEDKQKRKSGKPIETSRFRVSEGFFSREAYLTDSGRLHLESYASAMGNVYSFGPRFVANKLVSKKILAEMWMAEAEIAFSELQGSVECAVDFLKYICKWIMENCKDDLKFVSKRIDKHIMDRLQLVVTGTFERISYTEAIEVLNQATTRKFETKVEWGVSLEEEHESYLADEIYKKPLLICDHPKELKPFKVRLNDDRKTVASFDIIVPKVGTLIRGSQSEERYDMLNRRIKEMGLEKKDYDWYLDLRKHGNVKCSGFSFMFDPLVLYATGLNDVRDAVPFPISFGKIDN